MRKLIGLTLVLAILMWSLPGYVYAQVAQILLTSPFNKASVTTATNVKTSTGVVYGAMVYNPNSSVCYLDFFNATAANVTLGSTAPLMSIPVAATNVGGYIPSSVAVQFSTAISIAAVTATGGGSTCGSAMSIGTIFYQ